MKNKIENNKKIVMMAIALVCVIILCEAGYIIFHMQIQNRGVWHESNYDEVDPETREESKKKIEEQDSEEETENSVLEAEEIEKLLEEGTVLICVPAESMSLRRKPGFDSTIIDHLEAGEMVIWDGTKMEIDGTTFYQVVVRNTGRMGYVAADYCVEPDYIPINPLEKMTVVETNNSIYTYDMMVEDIEKLTEKYPDILTKTIIGKSLDGRDIYEITLGNEKASHHILAQGAIHGREYMTTQLLMKLVEYYAYYYAEGEYDGICYQDLLENTAIHIVPMTNPDGVTISQMGIDGLNNERYKSMVQECYERDKEYLVYESDSNGTGNWIDHYSDEKFNREKYENQQIIDFTQYQQIWKANAGGVDLNNNFDAGWDDLDLKETMSYGSYKGTSPVSEPETKALVKLASERAYDFYISYHSRGQLIYYDAKGNKAETSERSKAFAEMLGSCLLYETVNTQKGYNVNLGGFSDWIQLSLNGCSVTIESGKGVCPLSIDEFEGMWYRHREAWAKIMKEMYT